MDHLCVLDDCCKAVYHEPVSPNEALLLETVSMSALREASAGYKIVVGQLMVLQPLLHHLPVSPFGDLDFQE